MPTVLRSGPYRFFFYSGDRDEPPHVDVERDRCKAKYWLSVISLYSNSGFDRVELMAIYRLISKNQRLFLQKWHEYFDH